MDTLVIFSGRKKVEAARKAAPTTTFGPIGWAATVASKPINTFLAASSAGRLSHMVEAVVTDLDRFAALGREANELHLVEEADWLDSSNLSCGLYKRGNSSQYMR